MALFPDGPDAALRAAVAIQGDVAAYNDGDGRALQFPMGVGVGLHVGPTMLGTVGEEWRSQDEFWQGCACQSLPL